MSDPEKVLCLLTTFLLLVAIISWFYCCHIVLPCICASLYLQFALWASSTTPIETSVVEDIE